MWKLIEISQQSYFIHCKFTSSQEVTFILYDLKETWCRSLTFHEVKQNVKLLNKRYDFNEANIRDTLLNGEVHTAIIEQQPHTSSKKQENCVVKLKYLVKNCPFHLEWSLRRQTLEEFQASFMLPLFTALQGCFQQVEILTEVLRKKDAELTQYRKEGAVLHRKTLATKTFDFNDFTQKYKVTTELATNYTELAKFIINTNPKVEVFLNAQPLNKEPTKNEALPEENPISTKTTNTKMSPKQRKRKVHEMKQQQLERQLKVRKEKFAYESSQSQTTNSSGNSQAIDETLNKATEQKDLKDDKELTPKNVSESESGNKSTSYRKTTRCAPVKNYEENNTDSDNNTILEIKQQQLERQQKDRKDQLDYASSLSPTSQSNDDETLKISTKQKDLKELQTTPLNKREPECVHQCSARRRTTRCAPKRNYEEDKSSDNDTDSDNAESKKVTAQLRKSARKLNKGRTEISPTCEKCKNGIDNTKSSAGETSTKSPTLSYNSPKSSKGYPIQGSNNVYEFSTDSEYEITTKTQRKHLKTSPNMTEKRKTRSLPLVSTETKVEVAVQQQSKSPPSNKSKNLSHSLTKGADDISSQLDAIKKELKSLEALRLADLQQRMCKA